MEQSLFLPIALDLTLSNFQYTDTTINLNVVSSRVSSQCPICQESSSKIHSRYLRIIGDLPISGKITTVHLQVRKFFCENTYCVRKIFSERFQQHLQSYSRRFDRFNELLSSMGLELGGNLTRRIGILSFVKVSASTILRLIIKCPFQPIILPKIIGVNDWAFKKRFDYGTIIVDLEKNKVIDLLPDREAKTLTKWLLEHPSVEIVSRDRSLTYISAITETSKNIAQIADRWHILNNLMESFECFLNTQRQSIKQIAVELKSEEKIGSSDNLSSPILEIEQNIKPFPKQNHSKYLDNFVKAKQLQSEGHSKRKIAKLLGMSRNTLNRYWERTTFLPKVNHKKSNILDYEEYLIKRWNEGEQSAKICIKKFKKKALNIKLGLFMS